MKYYKPNIEELFIGYECQIKKIQTYKGIYARLHGEDDIYERNYTDVVIGKTNHDESIIHWRLDDNPTFFDACQLLKKGVLRTPYLTKQAIENEGFVFKKDLFKSWSFYKGSTNIQYLYEKHGMIIFDFDSDQFLYKGRCKSINEFRRIIKDIL